MGFCSRASLLLTGGRPFGALADGSTEARGLAPGADVVSTRRMLQALGVEIQGDASDVRVLGGDESLVVCGVELGMHGDRGPNGARGSARNLRRIGVRSIIGHSHSPEIAEGCYQTGTSTRLRLEYNSGPSSWLNAHVVLNADGKRQLVIIVDGRFRHVPK